jgi:hypothetical protein
MSSGRRKPNATTVSIPAAYDFQCKALVTFEEAACNDVVTYLAAQQGRFDAALVDDIFICVGDMAPPPKDCRDRHEEPTFPPLSTPVCAHAALWRSQASDAGPGTIV